MKYSTIFELCFFETNIISSNPKLFTVKYQKKQRNMAFSYKDADGSSKIHFVVWTKWKKIEMKGMRHIFPREQRKGLDLCPKFQGPQNQHNKLEGKTWPSNPWDHINVAENSVIVISTQKSIGFRMKLSLLYSSLTSLFTWF